MARNGRFSALHAVIVVACVAGVRAQDAAPAGALGELPLPAGLPAALAVAGDRAAPDRSQFLLEFIRRTYDMPIVSDAERRTGTIRALAEELGRPAAAGSAVETLPLPLAPSTWLSAVFGGRETAQSLPGAIIRSRGAALLYYGLLSLDDATRAWLESQPDLLGALASKYAPAFVIVAPALRISNQAVRVPGGDAAAPIWEALVGRPVTEPADFVRALVSEYNGRLAYFYAALSQLKAPQARFALDLGSGDAAARVASARRLFAIFEAVASGWRLDDQPFWRPGADPALLLADLGLDRAGALALDGTRRFWSAAFADSASNEGRELIEGERPEFLWLCEQVFTTKPVDQRRRYLIVLFASRTMHGLTVENARDALDAVRAAGRFPALVASLERARLGDLSAYARVAHRAAQLSALGDGPRALRAIAGFQGLLSMLTRASIRGGLPPDALAVAVTSLAAVETDRRGDYNAGLVRWLDGYLPIGRGAGGTAPNGDEAPVRAGAIEEAMLGVLAGPTPAEPQYVDWEGTRYRLDVSRAEAIRISRLLGDHPRPYLTAARRLVAIGDALARTRDSDEIARQLASLVEIGHALGWDTENRAHAPYTESLGDKSLGDRYREIERALRRPTGSGREPARVAESLVTLAEDAFARGLVEFVYATALGRPDRSGVATVAGDAALRHDLGLRPTNGNTAGPWEMPLLGSELGQGWRMSGSLLGLDVALANFALVPLSSKPPRRPTLSDADRRVMIEAVALVEPSALTDGDRDAIAAAIARGRQRLASVRRAADAAALVDDVPLDAARRSLLPWVAAHDPSRLSMFLSPLELLWLGLDGRTIPGLDAWGTPAQRRVGCLCLRFPDRRPWDALVGRARAGIVSGSFPDLNLRLAELLAEMKMPAPLLAGVLASATLDFVDNAISRDDYDRRGLVEFVQALRSDRVEQYLALLTTDGPLVPPGDGAEDPR